MIPVKSYEKWRVAVPNIRKEDGYIKRGFECRQEALKWQHKTGIEIWGYVRWLMILSGKLTRLRSWDNGVTIRLAKHRYRLATGSVVEYQAYMVRWYTPEGAEQAKQFSPSKYGGTLEGADIAANFFAVKKRAEMTGGELNLPESLFIKFSSMTKHDLEPEHDRINIERY